MAKLNNPFNLSGPLSGLVMYQRKDLDGTLVRTRAEISKERIRTDPAFANTLRHATEGGGRSRAAGWLRRVLRPLEAVRDHNWQGALTGALKPVQHRDTESPYGQRSVLFSLHGHLLDGYGLSRRTPWETLVRTPFTCSVDRAGLSARVEVPELTLGVNFHPKTPHPYFRVVTSLGVVPDVWYTPNGYTPKDTPGRHLPVVVRTPWRATKSGAEATSLELQLPDPIGFPSYALVLALALSFGSPDATGAIQPINYSGSGRIVAVV